MSYFKTWKYHNEKEISENFECLLCPMYVTSLIRNARTGLASSLLKEFPMSAIWCRMWKYEIIDTHFATQICSLAIAIMIVSIFLNIKFYACQHLCVYFPIGTFNIDLLTPWSKEIRYQFFFSASFGQPTAWSTVCSMVCNLPRKQLCLETL